jgi:hypothetical protein
MGHKTNNESNSVARRFLGDLTWHLGVPLAFLTFTILYLPIRERVGDFDEGINLMKGFLVMQGHSLYGEIWSDQPPLASYLIAMAIRVFEFRVGGIRLLVLLFSCVLLWASMQYLRITWGKVHALAGILMIIFLPGFVLYSIVIKIGLPALSFAILSLLLLTLWHQQRRHLWLVLSAISLGLSVLTKLFTGFLAPIFIIGIITGEYTFRKPEILWARLLRPAFLWGLTFTSVMVGLGLLLVGPANVPQLLITHFAARTSDFYRLNADLTIFRQLETAWITVFLALISGLFLIRKRRWLALYPLIWMVTGYLLLSQHSPVWPHQHLLVSLPAAILAGISVGEVLIMTPHIVRQRAFHRFSGLVAAATLTGVVLILAVQTPLILGALKPRPSISNLGIRMSAKEVKFLHIMKDYAPSTRWIVTDRPIYAFRVGLPVPPHLAVFSEKRLVTGELTEDQVLNTIREWEPEQVLLARFSFPSVEAYLEQDYLIVHQKPQMKLYVRKEIILGNVEE